MAFAGSSVELTDHEVTILQAWWRGILVRRKLSTVRDTYCAIFKSIEGPSNNLVHWKSLAPCKPALNSRQSEKKNVKEKNHPAKSLEQGSTVAKTSKQSTFSDASVEKHPLQNVLVQTEPQARTMDEHSSALPTDERTTYQKVEEAGVQTDKEVTNEFHTKTHNVANIHKLFTSDGQQTDQAKLPGSVAPTTSLSTSQNKPEEINTDRLLDSGLPGKQSSSDSPTPAEKPLCENITQIGKTQQSQVIASQEEADHGKHEKENSLIDVELKELGKEELQSYRSLIAMELLWVQQAIDSRKEYLKLRRKMTAC